MENMQKIKEMLMESIFEVFEKMYYIFLEPLDTDSGTYDMGASIGFHGPANGEIRILISKKMAGKMVQNMLNIREEDVTAKLLEDCLKESANMICGNFLRKLDSNQVFNLTLPTFDGNPVVADYTASLRIAFESEGDGMGVSMSMTDQT